MIDDNEARVYSRACIKELNPQIGFNVNSIQRQIQPLNTQRGLNVNSIQRQI